MKFTRFLHSNALSCRIVIPVLICSGSVSLLANSVTLQQPTATFSQSLSGDFSIARAIDGTSANGSGWGIQDNIVAQTAVFETASDIGFAGGSKLDFTLTQSFLAYPPHTLGRFRLSVTTDDRSSFADGKPNDGDVTANWTVLEPVFVLSQNGATLSVLADHSILASGKAPDTDVYHVSALTQLAGISGVRLEVLEDPSLPFNGPGREPLNGNFVLSEFQVGITSVPEPSMLGLVVLSLAGGATRLRRSQRRDRA